LLLLAVLQILRAEKLKLLVVNTCTAAGASWSSLDYGGAWKPLHYGLGRWFDDLALSTQHDLDDDVIKVIIWYMT
jgi:hypothetical protein